MTSELMRINKANQSIENAALVSLAIITVVISPWWTSDPFNTPKLLALVISVFSLSFSVINLNAFKQLFNDSKLIFVIFLFPINLISTFFLADANKWQQFYGYYGRKTGLLTYICLFLLFLVISVIYSNEFLKKFIRYFIFLGTFCAIYGILQPLGWFKIDILTSKNLPSSGFFGNTNFQSAFIGISMIMSFYLMHNLKKQKLVRQIQIFFIELLFLYAIYITDSQQGFIIALFGFSSIFLIKLFFDRGIKTFLALFTLFGLGFMMFVFGIFNKGPLAFVLYQPSVRAREHYWSAGLRMAQENPLIGVGLDSYGDWWWKYRDTKAIEFLGDSDFSTAAHNVYIDMSSSGGFPLMLSFFIFNLVIFLKGLQVLTRMNHFNIEFVTIFACWISFQVHLFLSINQIGIAIWGWVFSGLVFGYKLNSNNILKVNTISLRQIRIRYASGLIAGLIVSMPNFQESIAYFEAKRANSSTALYSYGKSYSQVSINLIYVANWLHVNNLDALSLEITRKLVNQFPNFYDGWNLMIFQPGASENEIKRAKFEIRRIDPRN